MAGSGVGVAVGDGVIVGDGVAVGDGVTVGDGVIVEVGVLVGVGALVLGEVGVSVFCGESAVIGLMTSSSAAVLAELSTLQPADSSKVMLATRKLISIELLANMLAWS